MQVFVYGTLKRGNEVRGHILNGSTFVGHGFVPGWHVFNVGPFPTTGPTAGEDAEWVRGEVYDVDEPTLETLDHIEGYPDFYDRDFVDVVLDDDETTRAIMYAIPKHKWSADLPIIKDGVWRRE